MLETQQAVVPDTRQSSASHRRLAAIMSRERATDRYWTHRDPINADRLWWRAQTVRHLFHLLPGETILELGCGSGRLTRGLIRATRGQCPITASSFAFPAEHPSLQALGPGVEVVHLDDFPGPLAGRTFDYVVGSNLLDLDNAAWLLQEAQHLLKPGGRGLFFETNPWNPIYRLRRALSRWLPFLGRGDERALLNQVQLYELLSELGYLRIGATPYDFLYRPVPGWLMHLARHLTLVLENTPGVKRLAGTVLLLAQKPPRDLPRPPVSLTEHPALHGAVSVVVPCHNEEMNVEPLVRGLLQHYGDYIQELILVEDNSTDRTREVLQRLAAQEPRIHTIFRQPPNGVGRALRDGLRRSTGKYALLMDCDFLHILPELREMFDAAVAGAEVVLGSRFSRESVLINYPLRKILCNRSFHVLASLLFRRRIRDFTNNLKLLKREVVDNLDLEADWFAVNAETGLKPLLMGYRVAAVPISWINRTPDMGQSSFSLLKNGWEYTKVLAALAWRSRCGFCHLRRPAEQGKPAPTMVLRSN